MDQQSGPQDSRVISYLALRKAVGIIGFSLPFVLAFGRMLQQGPGIEGSISCYYYTGMRNVLVGSLCAIGVFLLSTRGYDWRDEIAGRLACVFAIGVAFLPTKPCMEGVPPHECVAALHRSLAALLFLTLAYFCLALFTKTDPSKIPTRRKLQRNAVYRASGYTILACILVIGIVSLPSVNVLVKRCDPIFWLESMAVVAFGFAWLVKGETILKDDQP
jgi:hypothetical protein